METKTLYGKSGVREAFMAGLALGTTSPPEAAEAMYQKFLVNNPKLHSKPLTALQVVEHVSDYFNSFSNKEAAFIEALERQHRTLQQSFTKAVFMWIEHVATEEYRFDGRNEGSHKTAKKLMEGWKLLGEADENATHGSAPHQWLRMI